MAITTNNEPFELYLYGVIASRQADSDYVDSAYVQELLKKAGNRKVLVRINSPGGNVSEGVSIYNLLKRHKAGVDVIVDSLAASIASVIAMAGRTITMAQGATMMIHNPWTETVGDARAHTISVRALTTIKENLLDIYEQRTKNPRKILSVWLDEEYWLDAKQATQSRFADAKE